MLIAFSCKCGNNDVKKCKEYDGCLGYEAVVCTVCGRYSDQDEEHEPDDWSLKFVGLTGKTKRSN